MLHYLSLISAPFSAIMGSICTDQPLSVVIYSDAVVPGNPLRHDKGRTFEAIYWTLLEFPEWVLCRQSTWFCFGVLTSAKLAKIPGGLGSVIPYVLESLWHDEEVTYVCIKCNDEHKMVGLKFAGFLADLEGHAKMGQFKTTGATKPCISCANVVQFIDTTGKNTLVPLDCCNPNLFIRNTNEHMFAKADELLRAHMAGDTNQYKKTTEYGININPMGLLMKKTVRHIYRPVDHTIRDPMHMMVNDGIVGTEMTMVLQRLESHGIKSDTFARYALRWRLPFGRARKLDKRMFEKKKVGDHSMKLFASEVLTMVPVVNRFLQDQIEHRIPQMKDHCACFNVLNQLVGYISLGAHSAMKYIGKIRSLYAQHAEMYRALYSDQIRPKFHHGFHLGENAIAFVSCFVTERKNKDTKAVVANKFRHIESASIVDLVNQHCTHAAAGNMFDRRFLLEPRNSIVADDVKTSSTAVLPIGQLCKADVVYLQDSTVAAVHCFFFVKDDDIMMVDIARYKQVSKDIWEVCSDVRDYVEADEIVAAIPWLFTSGNRIQVIVPILYT